MGQPEQPPAPPSEPTAVPPPAPPQSEMAATEICKVHASEPAATTKASARTRHLVIGADFSTRKALPATGRDAREAKAARVEQHARPHLTPTSNKKALVAFALNAADALDAAAGEDAPCEPTVSSGSKHSSSRSTKKRAASSSSTQPSAMQMDLGLSPAVPPSTRAGPTNKHRASSQGAICVTKARRGAGLLPAIPSKGAGLLPALASSQRAAAAEPFAWSVGGPRARRGGLDSIF